MSTEPRQRPDAFPNTLWSEVVAAADHPAPSSKPALQNLCSRYWFPLYSYVRRNARDREEALPAIVQPPVDQPPVAPPEAAPPPRSKSPSGWNSLARLIWRLLGQQSSAA